MGIEEQQPTLRQSSPEAPPNLVQPQPPLLAASRPRHNDMDDGPFASQVHVLQRDGPGPRRVDVDPRDRDVVINIKERPDTVRVLHLQNVRADTLHAAERALDEFLAAVPHGGTSRTAHTMVERNDEVHLGLRDRLEARAEELGLDLDWDHDAFPRDSLRRSCSQPRYLLCFCDDGTLERTVGTRGVPWYP
ncbi:hypothetical protein EXIGLDRAFT_729046 [Exidia glandulosa HHB12029]|uniref:Uncharacterized protein n=1 Tax=Exidia glandulosa HHB12029 TaxID=1314781 RepID=A0A165CS83_EXIGL|nr:hypothetical protein EXIGLDRAFT_729046 [Exidia glandulosa HHB12029]